MITSAMSGSRWRSCSSSSPGEAVGLGERLSRGDREGEEQHAPGLGGEQLEPLGLPARAFAHESPDLAPGGPVGVRVGGALCERALERLQVGLHVLDAGPRADRLLDALGDLVRRAEVEVGGELQVQRHAQRVPLLEDRDVVDFLDERLRQGDREHALAQLEAARPGLDVNDHVAAGQRRLHGLLDEVGGAVRLDHRLARRYAHDHVGEVAARGLAQAQAAELDFVAEVGDRPLGRRARLQRRAVHQHVGVLQQQAPGGGEDQRRDRQRRDRVGLAETSLDRDEADQHDDRARHVGREVERVGAQRGAPEAPRRPQRDGDPARVDEQRHGDHRELVPADAGRSRAVDQVADPGDAHEDPSGEQDRRLSQRSEVLRAPVPVGVLRVRGPATEPHREERERGGDDVAAGLDPRGDQPEAAGRHADPELERHQQRRRRDRGDGRAPRRQRRLTLRCRDHR